MEKNDGRSFAAVYAEGPYELRHPRAASSAASSSAVGATSQYVYNVPPPPEAARTNEHVQTISSGANAGLQAQIVRMVQVTADSPAGDEARMIRNVKSLKFRLASFLRAILSYFPGPNFDFAGRVQTSENLFLAEGGGAQLFHSPIRAAGDVVRVSLPTAPTLSRWAAPARCRVPTAPNGCDAGKPACRDLQDNPDEGSSINGPTPAYSPTGTGTANGQWTTLSITTYAGNILSGTTGAKPLTLPFVQREVAGAIEIVRRPLPAESPSSLVGESRLYNQAQIRVLLSDDPNELPGGAGDSQNIRLANLQTNGAAPDCTNGVPVLGPAIRSSRKA